MKTLLIASCLLLLLQESVAPPPRRSEKEPHHNEKEKTEETGLEELGIEYERYLKEVIDVLESDPEFKRKLEAAEETDIRTGKIAHELEFVDHNVRSKLDEVKRAELERLRHLAQREFELTNDIDVDHMKIRPPEHLDHDNPHTFEINDLKKLIHKVTSDLNEADKKRREEFKEYEMQKEFENNEKLKHLDGAEKEAFEKQLKDNETKHKQHEPLHHPGSKQQLEEVWEKQDHMDTQEFNPKVFFQLHDLDGNGYWDQNEVKALFVKELDKMYQSGAPEDDMRERAEELERMREHVFREADKNQDQLLSFQEFMDQTKQPEFEKDPAWETVDQQPVYTHEEYMEFERRRQQEIQHMIQQGLIPPQPVYHVPPGYHHPQQQQQQQHFPQGQHQQQYPQHQQVHPGNQAAHPQFQQQQHPNAVPQGYGQPPNPVPQGYGQHPNAVPQGYAQHPNAPPQQGLHPNSHDYQPNALPHPSQGHQNPPPLPNQGYQNQVNQGYPSQNQGHQNAPVQPNQGYQNAPSNPRQGHPQGNYNPNAASQENLQHHNSPPQAHQTGGNPSSQEVKHPNAQPNGPSPAVQTGQVAQPQAQIQAGQVAQPQAQIQAGQVAPQPQAQIQPNAGHPNSLGGGSHKDSHP